MKKRILSFALFTTYILAAAQSEFVIYSGDTATDFFNIKPYVYNGLVVRDTLIAGQDTALYLTGKATDYFAGGFGAGRYNTSGAILISSLYKGDFAKTRLSFEAFTLAPGTSINIDLFKTADGITYPNDRWEYKFDLCPNTPCPTSFSALLSDFRAIDDNYMPLGPKMTVSDFEKVLGIQFNIIVNGNFGKGTASIIFDNLTLSEQEIITGIDDTVLFSNNEEVTVFDSIGRLIASAKFNDLHLESGKMYIVKSGNKARKLIVK